MYRQHCHFNLPSNRMMPKLQKQSQFNQLSEEILSSSKMLMSKRLVDIENRLMETINHYPKKQQHMFKQMLYQNLNQYHTVQQKISYLMTLVDQTNVDRVNSYLESGKREREFVQTDTSIHYDSPHQKHKITSTQQSKHPNQEQNTLQDQNYINSNYRNNPNSKLNTPQLHKHCSKTSLNPHLSDECLYSSLVNSQKSEQFNNFVEMHKSRKSEHQLEKMETLLETDRIKHHLKLLKMAKQLAKYQNKVSSPKITQSFEDSKYRGPKNIFQRSNCSIRENSFEYNQNKNRVEDLFSFRPHVSNFDSILPNIPQFRQIEHEQNQLNDLISGSNSNLSTKINDIFQETTLLNDLTSKSIVSSDYNQKLQKLQQLQEERFLQQKEDKLKNMILSEKYNSHLEENGKNLLPKHNQMINKFEKNNSQKGYICYSESSKRSLDSYSQSNHFNEEQNFDDSNELLSKQFMSKNEFKKKPQLIIYSSAKQSDFGGKKQGNKKMKNQSPFKSNRSQSKSMECLHKSNHSRLKSNQLKQKMNKNCSQFNIKNSHLNCKFNPLDQSPRKRNQKTKKGNQDPKKETVISLRKEQEKNGKKLEKMKSNGDFDVSRCSDTLKRYLIERSKSIPSLISPISYDQQKSNQNQIQQRKKVDESRQKQIQQKIIAKSQSTQLFYN